MIIAPFGKKRKSAGGRLELLTDLGGAGAKRLDRQFQMHAA